MASIGESSKAYEPPTRNNITELELVSIDWELKSETQTFQDKDEETGEVKEKVLEIEYVEVAGIKYRVPQTVKKQLKEQLKENPDLKWFKVTKSGSGLGTQYTVIPKFPKGQEPQKSNSSATEPPKVVEEEIKDA